MDEDEAHVEKAVQFQNLCDLVGVGYQDTIHDYRDAVQREVVASTRVHVGDAELFVVRVRQDAIVREVLECSRSVTGGKALFRSEGLNVRSCDSVHARILAQCTDACLLRGM